MEGAEAGKGLIEVCASGLVELVSIKGVCVVGVMSRLLRSRLAICGLGYQG